jgi:hypothetical protein
MCATRSAASMSYVNRNVRPFRWWKRRCSRVSCRISAKRGAIACKSSVHAIGADSRFGIFDSLRGRRATTRAAARRATPQPGPSSQDGNGNSAQSDSHGSELSCAGPKRRCRRGQSAGNTQQRQGAACSTGSTQPQHHFPYLHLDSSEAGPSRPMTNGKPSSYLRSKRYSAFRVAHNERMTLLKTLSLFVATALAEIVGCFLPYLWLKQDKTTWLLLPAAALGLRATADLPRRPCSLTSPASARRSGRWRRRRSPRRCRPSRDAARRAGPRGRSRRGWPAAPWPARRSRSRRAC